MTSLEEQFISVTGADAKAAKFYLELSAGNLELAIHYYLESPPSATTSSSSSSSSSIRKSTSTPSVVSSSPAPPAAPPTPPLKYNIAATEEMTKGSYHALYVYGDNTDQMLATGKFGTPIDLQPISYFPFHEYKIADVPNGKSSATVMHLINKNTGKSELFACGRNNFGHLTTAVMNGVSSSGNELRFQRMGMRPFENKKILHVAVGGDHVVLQTEDLQFFGTGYNSSGNLGIDERNELTTKQWFQIPIAAQLVQKLVHSGSVDVDASNKISLHSISCGYNHTVLLLANRKSLIIFGENGQGQLGIGNKTNVFKPTLVEKLPLKPEQRIAKVVCGFYITCFLTDDGCLFLAGQNVFKGGSQEKEFVLIDTKKPVQDVSIGQQSAAFITTDLKVYVASDRSGEYTLMKKSGSGAPKLPERWIEIDLERVNEALLVDTSRSAFRIDTKTRITVDPADRIILANSANQVIVIEKTCIDLYYDFGMPTSSQRIIVTAGGYTKGGLRFFWRDEHGDIRLFEGSLNPLCVKAKQNYKDVTITFRE